MDVKVMFPNRQRRNEDKETVGDPDLRRSCHTRVKGDEINRACERKETGGDATIKESPPIEFRRMNCYAVDDRSDPRDQEVFKGRSGRWFERWGRWARVVVDEIRDGGKDRFPFRDSAGALERASERPTNKPDRTALVDSALGACGIF